eukprot:460125-Rhodomonas_salina.1
MLHTGQRVQVLRAWDRGERVLLVRSTWAPVGAGIDSGSDLLEVFALDDEVDAAVTKPAPPPLVQRLTLSRSL